MNANDAAVVNVFTRRVSGAIADEILSALFNMGADFDTNIIVRDITANDDITATPAGFSGSTDSADWPNQPQEFVYTVSAANLTGRENHICEVLAYLQVGVSSPNVSFETSPKIILRGA